jgi:HSP20 family protein
MAPTTPVKLTPTALKPTTLFEGTFAFPLFQRLSRFSHFGLEQPTFETMPAAWTPALEMFTKNNELVVRAEIPGLKKEDVIVEVTDENLVIRGERKEEKEEKGKGFYRSERTYGSFYRTVPLPEGVKTETAKATVNNGVLEIIMPMAKVEEKKRTLEINEPAPEKAATKAA